MITSRYCQVQWYPYVIGIHKTRSYITNTISVERILGAAPCNRLHCIGSSESRTKFWSSVPIGKNRSPLCSARQSLRCFMIILSVLPQSLTNFNNHERTQIIMCKNTRWMLQDMTISKNESIYDGFSPGMFFMQWLFILTKSFMSSRRCHESS